MRITLNDSIPEDRRPQVERVVKAFVRVSDILWLPSRFPRLVMLIEPGGNDSSDPEKSSIFDSPQKGMAPIASMTTELEERIKACLAKPDPRV